jgi:dihydroorotase
MEDRGNLKKDSIADITVINLRKEHRIDSSSFYSRAKYSSFDGWKVRGKAVKTFVNGQLTMDDGEIQTRPGSGSVILRQSYLTKSNRW